MIVVSGAVVREIKHRREQAEASAEAVRIGIRRGGCSGLEYTFDFDADYAPEEILLEHEDIVFVCDCDSRPALSGLKLDYCGALAGGGFKFDNPNAARTCGCGASFQLRAPSES